MLGINPMMPRHRKDRGPRYGALRREGASWRSVLPRLPRFGPVGRRGARAGAPRARPRLARSLLATPWFAAGAGIVIAAVLAVESPTALTYGPTFPIEQCPVHGCASNSGHPAGQPAAARPGVALKTRSMKMRGGRTARSRRRGRRARGAPVAYQIVRQWSSGFLAEITVPATARRGGWSLQFAFPALHINGVWGGRWEPSGNGDGGTAYGAAGSSGGSWRHGRPDASQLFVSVSGAPQGPSDCVLDGATCHFDSQHPPSDG
jgi:hypothetical protein